MESEKKAHLIMEDSNAYFDINQMMQIKYIYGFRSDPQKGNSIQELKDTKNQNQMYITYIAGNCLVILNQKTLQQIIIPGTPGTNYIQTYVISSSYKYIAISEVTKDNGMITVYEIKNLQENKIRKKRTFLSKQLGSKSFNYLFFTSEKEKLLTAYSADDIPKISIWEWEKGKLKTFCEIQGFEIVRGLFLQSKTEDMIFCYGKPQNKNITFRTFQIKKDQEKLSLSQKFDTVKDFLKNYDNNILCHQILDDGNIVFGNESGEILILNKQYELKTKIVFQNTNIKPVTILVKWKNSFIAVAKEFKFHIFERNQLDIKTPYQYAKQTIQVKNSNKEGIQNLLNTTQGNLIVGLTNGEFLQLEKLQNDEKKFEYNASPILMNFHKDQIVDLCISYKKPYIATCSQDKTVKVWDYLRNELVYTKTFQKSLKSVSFHPNGIQFAVAVKDKICLINLGLTELQVFKEISVRDTKIIKFSNGGQYLAIVNQKKIQIYDFYRLSFINKFCYEEHKHTINNIEWLSDDFHIISSSVDGQIIKWNICEFRQEEFVQKQEAFQSISMSLDSQSNRNYLVTSTLTNHLNLIYIDKQENNEGKNNYSENNESQNYEFKTKKIVIEEQISNLQISNNQNYLFISLGESLENEQQNGRGAVLVTSFQNLKEFAEINCCFQGVTNLRINHNDSFVFATGRDNSIIIIKVKEDYSNYEKEAENIGISTKDYFLYDEDKLLKQREEIELLTKKVQQQEKINEQKSQKENQDRIDQIQMLNEEIQIMQQESKNLITEIQLEIQQEQENFENNHKEIMQAHILRKNQLQNQQQKKMETEQIKFNKIMRENEQMINNVKQQIETIKIEQEQQKQEILQQNKEIISELDLKIEELQNKKQDVRNYYQTKIEEVEELLDEQVFTLKEKYNKDNICINKEKLQKEKEVIENKRKFQDKEQEKIFHEKELKKIDDQIENLQKKIVHLQEQQQKNEEALQDKEKTIKQKIERISKLNEEKQNLNKSKYTLDFKIKQLKQEKGPREEEIAKMKQQLHNMQIEIEQFMKTNTTMKLSVNQYNLKLQGLTNLLEENSQQIKEKKRFLKNFENHISDMLTKDINDYKDLKKKLLFLYNNYVQNIDQTIEENVDKRKAFAEQRAYQESCIKTLKEKFLKNIQVHQNDNKRIMKENVDLINTINELKREKKVKTDNASKIIELKMQTKKEIDLCLKIQKNNLILKELDEKIEKAKKCKKVQFNIIIQSKYTTFREIVILQKALQFRVFFQTLLMNLLWKTTLFIQFFKQFQNTYFIFIVVIFLFKYCQHLVNSLHLFKVILLFLRILGVFLFQFFISISEWLQNHFFINKRSDRFIYAWINKIFIIKRLQKVLIIFSKKSAFHHFVNLIKKFFCLLILLTLSYNIMKLFFYFFFIYIIKTSLINRSIKLIIGLRNFSDQHI